MARTTLTKIAAPGRYPTAGVTCTFTAANATNKEQFVMNGDDLLIARNVGAGPVAATISSVANTKGRVRDATQTIAAGAYYAFGPFRSLAGWVQSDGKAYIESNTTTDLEWSCIKLS